jgi:hypothetical protein
MAKRYSDDFKFSRIHGARNIENNCAKSSRNSIILGIEAF